MWFGSYWILFFFEGKELAGILFEGRFVVPLGRACMHPRDVIGFERNHALPTSLSSISANLNLIF
jgi:hypothetical protein